MDDGRSAPCACRSRFLFDARAFKVLSSSRSQPPNHWPSLRVASAPERRACPAPGAAELWRSVYLESPLRRAARLSHVSRLYHVPMAFRTFSCHLSPARQSGSSREGRRLEDIAPRATRITKDTRSFSHFPQSFQFLPLFVCAASCVVA